MALQRSARERKVATLWGWFNTSYTPTLHYLWGVHFSSLNINISCWHFNSAYKRLNINSIYVASSSGWKPRGNLKWTISLFIYANGSLKCKQFNFTNRIWNTSYTQCLKLGGKYLPNTPNGNRRQVIKVTARRKGTVHRPNPWPGSMTCPEWSETSGWAWGTGSFNPPSLSAVDMVA